MQEKGRPLTNTANGPDTAPAAAGDWGSLLLPEGLAVGALVHGGVTLVGANQNPVQSAVVAAAAVVGALGDGAFDTLVAVAVHNFTFFSWDGISMALFLFLIHGFFLYHFFRKN